LDKTEVEENAMHFQGFVDSSEGCDDNGGSGGDDNDSDDDSGSESGNCRGGDFGGGCSKVLMKGYFVSS
jgi:hypothetical protein